MPVPESPSPNGENSVPQKKPFPGVDLAGHNLPPSPAPSSPRTGRRYALATELVYTEGNDQFKASSVPIYQVRYTNALCTQRFSCYCSVYLGTDRFNSKRALRSSNRPAAEAASMTTHGPEIQRGLISSVISRRSCLHSEPLQCHLAWQLWM